MKKRLPAVTLIWLYQGKNAIERRLEIEEFDYPDFRIVESVHEVPADTEICIFWRDDDKPVTKYFISEMTKPLIMDLDFRAVMHFWSGNAISLPKKMLDESGTNDGSNPYLILKMLLPCADSGGQQPDGRIHVAFSSTERLAPLTVQLPGAPC
jgi:hypothetical protein